MTFIHKLASTFAVLGVLTLAGGCGPQPAAPKGGGGKAPVADDESHEHGTGPHGGCIADWGGGKMHIEFAVDHAKQEATVYILGKNEKTPTPIAAKDGQITGSLKGAKSKEAFQIVLKAAPQMGDPEGKASRFVGKHEKLGVEQEFEGTISGVVDGTPYTGDFKEEPEKPAPKK